MKHCNEQVAGPLARQECMIAKTEAFCFAFRTDNTGPPQDADEVIAGFSVARTQFPGTDEIVAGSLDAFFSVARSDETLPVITGEIGDVWIPGVSSDPKKASTTRRMQRAWDAFHSSHDPSRDVFKAGVYMLKLTEHTWGLSDLRNKSVNWTNEVLEKQLAAGDFDTNINDWDLQRDFTRFAAKSLPKGHPLKTEWAKIIARAAPSAPNVSSYKSITAGFSAAAFHCPASSLGAIIVNESTGDMTIGGLTLGTFHYSNLNEAVYNTSKFACDAVFGGKPGSSNYTGGKRSKNATAAVRTIHVLPTWSNDSTAACDFWLELDIVGQGDGLPSAAWTRFLVNKNAVDITFLVLNKTRTRFNEAGWLSFKEATPSGLSSWGMQKLMSDVTFDDIVAGGSTGVHAADHVTWKKQSGGIMATIDSIDAPVLSPISALRPPSVLLNDQETLQRGSDIEGVAFNLWNNAWSTNYLFFYPWHDKDASIAYQFRVTL